MKEGPSLDAELRIARAARLVNDERERDCHGATETRGASLFAGVRRILVTRQTELITVGFHPTHTLKGCVLWVERNPDAHFYALW